MSWMEPQLTFTFPRAVTAAATTCLVIMILFADILVGQPASTSSRANLPNFTAVIAFGDSTIDTGNNNYLPAALFKADHAPYGESLPGKHTGRFADGMLIPDFAVASYTIAMKQLLPPFLDPNLSDEDIRTGVSFGSAGTGYDDLTAEIAQAIPMWKQVELFEEYKVRLRGIVGDDEAEKIIEGSLVLISAGTNDLGNNYYGHSLIRRLQFDLDDYQDFLIARVQIFVKQIYDIGGRTIAVAGVPPVGCLPIQMVSANPLWRTCVEDQNLGSQSYNAKLKKMLSKFHSSLPVANSGVMVAYSDVYNPVMDMITHPMNYDFVEARKGWCGSGVMELGMTCNSAATSMTRGKNKLDDYVFFDTVHPTSKAYQYLTFNLTHQLASLYK